MKVCETPLPGVLVIEQPAQADERGAFRSTFRAEDFIAHGLPREVWQTATSSNRSRGTLRGLHYQAAPHAQPKLVHCQAGAVFDVVADLRRAKPAWFAVELTADNDRMLFVPAGCAHGFLTLTDGAEVAYTLFAPRIADAERGVRWDDPAIGIDWPFAPSVMSDRDRAYADFVA